MADPLLTKRDLLLFVEQVSTSGAADARDDGRMVLAPASPHRFKVTGAQTQTSLISTALSTASDTAYVGCYLEALDGDHVGQLVQITDFANGTDAATHEAWPSASGLPGEVRMWYPPEPVVVATSAAASGTSTITATGRGEGARYWAMGAGDSPAGAVANNRKYMLIGKGNANDARAYEVKSWDETGKIFTIDGTLAGAVAVGDLFVPRKAFYPTGGKFTIAPTTTHIERPYQRADMDRIQGVRGARGCPVACDLELKGSAVTAQTADAFAIPPLETSPVLRGVFAETMDKHSAVATANSANVTVNSQLGTRLEITDAKAGNFSIGNFVLVSGEMAVVSAKDATPVGYDQVDVEPRLSQNPANGTAVGASVTYKPATSGHLGAFVEAWIGDRGHFRTWGGMTDLSIENFAVDQIPVLKLSFPGRDYVERYVSSGAYGASTFVPVYDTTLPFDAKAVTVKLGAFGAALSKIAVRRAVVRLGQAIKERQAISQGRAGEQGSIVTDRKPIVELVVDYEDHVRWQQYHKGTILSCLIQHGDTAGATIGIYARKCEVMQQPEIGEENDMKILTLRLMPVQSDVTSVATLALGFA